jgi:hypothetical protein
MAKKAIKKTATKSGGLSSMQAFREHVLAIDGKNSTVVGDKTFVSIAIPIPLAFQYFLDITGLPVGLVYQLTGNTDSRKTTFAFEVMRWVGKLGGSAELVLTEGKFSDSLAKAFCGYPGEEDYTPVVPRELRNMQEWQIHINNYLDACVTAMEKGFTDRTGKKHPPGIEMPIGIVVDSVVAQLTESQTNKISSEGGSDRGFAVHVKSLGDWIAVLQAKITCRPFVMLLINHISEEQVSMFEKEIKQKGGRRIGYESSLILLLSSSKESITVVDKPGYAPEESDTLLTFKLSKSSMGVSRRVLKVRLHTQHEIVGPGEARQRNQFLWGESLVEILKSHMYAADNSIRLTKSHELVSSRKLYRERILAVTDFREVKGGFTCEKYTNSDTEVLTAQALGEFLEADAEFVALFRELFAIKHYAMWPRGEDFYKVLARERASITANRTKIPVKKG